MSVALTSISNKQSNKHKSPLKKEKEGTRGQRTTNKRQDLASYSALSHLDFELCFWLVATTYVCIKCGLEMNWRDSMRMYDFTMKIEGDRVPPLVLCVLIICATLASSKSK